MTPEAAFAKAWGREPTRLERERIRRLQSAFAIEENDALLTIAMVLEFYDGVFRLYPGRCADSASDAVKRWLESAEAKAILQKAVTLPCAAGEPSPTPALPTMAAASSTADSRRELYWVTLGGLATASSAISGALGMVVGSSVSARPSCWASASNSLAVQLLGAPMGWVVFLSLIVPAYYWASWGWRRGSDSKQTRRERCL